MTFNGFFSWLSMTNISAILSCESIKYIVSPMDDDDNDEKKLSSNDYK